MSITVQDLNKCNGFAYLVEILFNIGVDVDVINSVSHFPDHLLHRST